MSEVLQPIIEDRMENSELALQEKMKVEEFYDLIEADNQYDIFVEGLCNSCGLEEVNSPM